MTRPLIISDCDEVLLHMVVPFKEWLDEDKAIDFALDSADFTHALNHRDSGDILKPEEIWALLGGFFDSEMYRQKPIKGAIESIIALSQHADIVVLTNLMDDRMEARKKQLAGFGLDVSVYCNQGPKGPALAKIIEEYKPSIALFIDDLANHHQSVGEIMPDIWRLHMVGEPKLAPHIKAAAHAHNRIDDWEKAKPWIENILTSGKTAPAL